MTCCPPICRKRKQKEKKKVVRKTKEEKTVEELVPRRFWKWKRVFGKAELKKGFMSKKGKVYSLSREKQEEVQVFVENQLQKGYIQLSKSPQTSPVHFVAKKDRKQ